LISKLAVKKRLGGHMSTFNMTTPGVQEQGSLFPSPPVEETKLLSMSQHLLTDPVLLHPTETSVNVVWFTLFPGENSYVQYGEGLKKLSQCHTTVLSRFPVYRHEAVLSCLNPTQYRAISATASSDIFSCGPAPSKGSDVQVLLTSDHQNKPMVPANLQKVLETAHRIDAVFYGGDCVTNPDNPEDWFDASSGHSFFSVFQRILPRTPIFCTLGNHEIKWIKGYTFNTTSFNEIFSLEKQYYASTFGDIRLVVLCATRIGRDATLGIRGKYTEDSKDFEDPSKWGYGEFIVEPLQKGSPQYVWLEKEFQSEEFKNAKYKIVMLHNPIHTLGENQVPAFANPIQHVDRDESGKITRIWYEYPKDQDFLMNDIDPLFAQYGVQLVYSAHSHIWCRFTSPRGVHYLESSNVGNSYGAIFKGAQVFSDHCVVGGGRFEEPNGLSPVIPTISPLLSSDGVPLPFIASNEITVFSVFNTKSGCVDSYYFDTKNKGDTVHFDRFSLTK
jgi:hypothetical protein